MISFVHLAVVIGFGLIFFLLSKYVIRKLHLWDEISIADRSIVFLLTFIMCFLTMISIILIFYSEEVTFLGI